MQKCKRAVCEAIVNIGGRLPSDDSNTHRLGAAAWAVAGALLAGAAYYVRRNPPLDSDRFIGHLLVIPTTIILWRAYFKHKALLLATSLRNRNRLCAQFIWIGMLFLALAVLGGVNEWRHLMWPSAEAVVVQKERRPGIAVLTFEFDVAGHRQTGRGALTGGLRPLAWGKGYAPGTSETIRYNPEDPEEIEIFAWDDILQIALLLVLPSVLFLAVGVKNRARPSDRDTTQRRLRDGWDGSEGDSPL